MPRVDPPTDTPPRSTVLPLVLIADDDPAVHRFLGAHLASWGYRVEGVPDRTSLLASLCRESPALVLLDLRLGSDDGLQVLAEVLRLQPRLPVVLFTGHGSIPSAVEAVRQGARDYLTKPADLDRLRPLLAQFTNRAEPPRGDRSCTAQLLGDTPSWLGLLAQIRNVAATGATTLILGESGTGKELVARALHDGSPRRDRPFVPVNMAALPRELAESTLFGHERGAFTGATAAQVGCCEAAEGGTLFLDEIGEMDLALQAKLLRFLQERTVQRVGSSRPRKVDVRVVAATNRDLHELARLGRFREDLYYRLHVVPLSVPPLRERREDVPLLANRFLTRAAARHGRPSLAFSPEAITILQGYDWPGNVRQLENLAERLAILSPTATIGPAEVRAALQPPSRSALTSPPASVAPVGPPAPVAPPGERSGTPRPIEELEREAIHGALVAASGNVTAAARMIGLSPATVYRKIKRFAIDLDNYGRGPGEAT